MTLRLEGARLHASAGRTLTHHRVFELLETCDMGTGAAHGRLPSSGYRKTAESRNVRHNIARPQSGLTDLMPWS